MENLTVAGGGGPLLIDLALLYARLGLPVFPVIRGGKRPLVERGFHSASLDPGVIRAWWAQWQDANIGVATGAPAGVWVLDVDPRHGGDRSLEELVKKNGPLPATPQVLTGGGGMHFYFRLKEEEVGRLGSRTGVLPGIDVKSAGGYVVAAGSIHESGNRYAWAPGARIGDVPLANAPPWLLSLVVKGRSTVRTAVRPPGIRFSDGTRNDSMVSMGGTMRRVGFDEEAIAAALNIQNRLSCDPPLDERDVRRVSQSVARYAPEASAVSDLGSDAGLSRSGPSPFRTAAELCSSSPETVPWIARPWLVAGAITQLTGKPKTAGKTTFLLRLVAAILDGGDFLEAPTAKTPVVYLTEERDATLVAALGRAGLRDRVDLHLLQWHRVTTVPWLDAAQLGHKRCKEVGARLFVIDTIGQFAQLRGDGENDSGTALEMLRPLQSAAADGIAVLVVHHDRKGVGDVGESARGSSALTGSADIVMSVRRLDGTGHDACRAIHTLSRFGEVPEKLIIDLTDAGYVARGSDEAVALGNAGEAIMSTLVAAAASLTVEELTGRTEVKRATCQRAIDRLLESGQVRRVGTGRKGDPYRYENAFRPTKEVNGWAESNGVARHHEGAP